MDLLKLRKKPPKITKKIQSNETKINKNMICAKVILGASMLLALALPSMALKDFAQYGKKILGAAFNYK